MAMVGNYKKGLSWRRSYGTMVVLAFGAAMVGAMSIQKLRETRIHNLIVKQKDEDFYYLHQLLLKERDYSEEVKRKNEELQRKIYSLRTQKMELDRRVSEMQSAIYSLQDELKTLQVSLVEKQDKTERLRGRLDDQIRKNESRESSASQLVALVESLKQKEAEIARLKRRLESPETVSSLATFADSSGSSPPVNATLANDIGNENGDGTEEKVENVRERSVEDNKISGIDQTSENEDDTSSNKEETDDEDHTMGRTWVSITTNTGLENNGRSNRVSRERHVRFPKDKKKVKRASLIREAPLTTSESFQHSEGRKADNKEFIDDDVPEFKSKDYDDEDEIEK